MRERKYRAWDIKEKKMLSFDDSGLSPCRFVHDGGLDDMFSNMKDEVILMEDTGIKDMNGVNIYEGDLVRYRNDEDYLYEVKYIPEDCQIRAVGITESQRRYLLGYKICKDLVVVGNIFENAELLDEG